MPINIETLSLISAVQAMVLAVMLWMGVRAERGFAGDSLRLRAAALAIEGMGWSALTLQVWISPAQLLLGGNALNLLAQAMVVIAVRMLLGAPLRLRLVAVIAVLGWLGVGWFGVVHPDYRLRMLWGSLTIIANLALQAEALLRGRSRARTALLLLCAVSAALLVWRNGEFWFAAVIPSNIGEPNGANYLYVLFAGMQPLFASVGFLLLYSEVLQSAMHKLARTDPLTGVNNRLALSEAARKLLAAAARAQQPVGVLMLDADHFKSVNDRFGHAVGDKVLLGLVASILSTLRTEDVIGRVGGEEFVVLAPNTSLQSVTVLAERIRAALGNAPLLVEGHTLRLTVSIGAAVARDGERDVAAVLRRADQALYAAKRAGRNCVMTSESAAATALTPALDTGAV